VYAGYVNAARREKQEEVSLHLADTKRYAMLKTSLALPKIVLVNLIGHRQVSALFTGDMN
jgi:hypothetical protein